MNAIKEIKAKQTVFNRLYLLGCISKAELRRRIRDYAQFVWRIYGK